MWSFHSQCSCGKLFVPILGYFLRINPEVGLWAHHVCMYSVAQHLVGSSCVRVFRGAAPCGTSVPGHHLATELERPLPSLNPRSSQKQFCCQFERRNSILICAFISPLKSIIEAKFFVFVS